MPPVIDYRRAFDFDLTPAELWAALDDGAAFERWWPWLRDFRIDGGGLRTGAVLHGVVVPPLPYRMRLDVELLRVRRASLVDACVHGDLEGDARLVLRRAGAGTTAEVSWTLEMMQMPMRLASRVAHPLLVRAHDAVVDMTVAGFRRRLAEGR